MVFKKNQHPWNYGLKGKEYIKHYLKDFKEINKNKGKGKKKLPKTKETRKKLSNIAIKRWKENKMNGFKKNNEYGKSNKGKKQSLELRKRKSENKKLFYIQYPEKHPNRNMNKISIPQKKLYDYLKQYYFVNIELEYPIKGKFQTYYLDIAIPSIKVNFEYDGEYWHRETKYLDEVRDSELNKLGWLVIRINKNNVSHIDFIMEKIIKL